MHEPAAPRRNAKRARTATRESPTSSTFPAFLASSARRLATSLREGKASDPPERRRLPRPRALLSAPADAGAGAWSPSTARCAKEQQTSSTAWSG